MNAKNMTPRQLAIVSFMKQHLAEHQRLPTIREIASEFGIRSPNGVVAHLQALVRHGVITRSQKQRAINYRLTGVLLRLEPAPSIQIDPSTISTLSRRSAATTSSPDYDAPKSLQGNELVGSPAAADPYA